MPEPAEIRRRVHLGAHRVGIEECGLVPVLLGRLRRLGEPGDLVGAGGHVDDARFLPARVDAAAGERLAHRGEVLRAQAPERADLLRPPR
jgi:hypothetical protein